MQYHKCRVDQYSNIQNDSQVNQPNTSYRPSSISATTGGNMNNVVDITERFVNSPMMTQFSDASEPQRHVYHNIHSRDVSNPRPQEYSYSHGYNQSSSYSQHHQHNRSDESIHASQNPYENQPNNANYSRMYEDQVLFKSNGFDGNATSSGKANESALPQSPTIYEKKYKDHSDSKLKNTANFERPKEYDVKYSDYRKSDNTARTIREERSSYDQKTDYYNNPFKSTEYIRDLEGAGFGYHHTQPSQDYSVSAQNYNIQSQDYSMPPPEYNSRVHDYSMGQKYQVAHDSSIPQDNAGSYKYLPRWENPDNRASYNAQSEHIYSSQSYDPNVNKYGIRGPPKYLEPHEESKYDSNEGKIYKTISFDLYYKFYDYSKPNLRRL